MKMSDVTIDSNHWALRQVGWLGHKDGTFYSLDGNPRNQEPGGYSPIYIQIGTFKQDSDTGKWYLDD